MARVSHPVRCIFDMRRDKTDQLQWFPLLWGAELRGQSGASEKYSWFL